MLDTDRPKDSENVRGLWFVGPPSTGKSYAARDLAMKLYNQHPFTITESKWFDSYNKEKVIIIEDLDYITAHTHAHNLKHWSDKYACQAEFKGGKTWLHHELLIVTSNYTIEELFQADDEKHSKRQQQARDKLYDAIKRRFEV